MFSVGQRLPAAIPLADPTENKYMTHKTGSTTSVQNQIIYPGFSIVSFNNFMVAPFRKGYIFFHTSCLLTFHFYNVGTVLCKPGRVIMLPKPTFKTLERTLLFMYLFD